MHLVTHEAQSWVSSSLSSKAVSHGGHWQCEGKEEPKCWWHDDLEFFGHPVSLWRFILFNWLDRDLSWSNDWVSRVIKYMKENPKSGRICKPPLESTKGGQQWPPYPRGSWNWHLCWRRIGLPTELQCAGTCHDVSFRDQGYEACSKTCCFFKCDARINMCLVPSRQVVEQNVEDFHWPRDWI